MLPEPPVEFVDEDDLCDHDQLKNDCNICYAESYANDYIDEIREDDRLQARMDTSYCE